MADKAFKDEFASLGETNTGSGTSEWVGLRERKPTFGSDSDSIAVLKQS